MLSDIDSKPKERENLSSMWSMENTSIWKILQTKKVLFEYWQSRHGDYIHIWKIVSSHKAWRLKKIIDLYCHSGICTENCKIPVILYMIKNRNDITYGTCASIQSKLMLSLLSNPPQCLAPEHGSECERVRSWWEVFNWSPSLWMNTPESVPASCSCHSGWENSGIQRIQVEVFVSAAPTFAGISFLWSQASEQTER